MIASAVVAKLSSLTLPFNLTNANGTMRIYPNYVRQSDKGYPQLVFDCDNNEYDETLSGDDGSFH